MINYDNINNTLGSLDPDDQDFIFELSSHFHIRDDKMHKDGSRGTIKITHKQFCDALAYAFLRSIGEV